MNAKLIRAVEELTVTTYQLPDGTKIKGQSISYLSLALRDSGWRGVSHLHDLECELEANGFKVVKAQMVKFEGSKHEKLCTPARVVTQK